MKKSILSSLIAGTMLASSIIGISAAESQYPNYAEGENNSNLLIVTYATGLIANCSVSFSVSNKTLTISGYTNGSEVLKQIGFKDIKVERSSNGTSWTTEKNLGDFLSNDKKNYTLSTDTTVTGGYYYKITCTHYAKEDTFWFPTTQSISNTTSYVWIS